MSEAIRTIPVDASDITGSIAAGFEKLAPSSPASVALIFPTGARIEASLAEAIGAAADAVTSLRELVLVHPGASVGFLASSLGLRLPQCQVHAERNITALEERRPRSLTPPSGTAQILDFRDRSIEEALVAAGSALRVRAGNRAVLLLDPDETPPAGLTDVVVEQLSSCPRLRELTLVHPSAVMGFVASSANLRLPNLSLAAMREQPAE